ncbi:hypothetical protein BGZ61DRAFT_463823 [Ilyonectria robusta]|uniref:uncharacterized protein n=1 Tax=Ilyonectria robusta TaxID=1079257 RepID=UPI001E8D7196|nr:uncharacterized protein BGZ61DRAFT_463823 [Ilyonectria robusta]KAH8661235.1 hypothetical protein BGZ61DRAFT_463823 [Ilyonectria robusta]
MFIGHFYLIFYQSSYTRRFTPIHHLGAGYLMHVSPCLAIAGFLSAAPRPNLFANPRPPTCTFISVIAAITEYGCCLRWLYLCRVLPSLLRPTGKLCPGKCIGRDRERPSVHFSK